MLWKALSHLRPEDALTVLQGASFQKKPCFRKALDEQQLQAYTCCESAESGEAPGCGLL